MIEVEQEGDYVVIRFNGWRLRVFPAGDYLDLNMMDNKMSGMCVLPQSGNVIRIRPEQRTEGNLT